MKPPLDKQMAPVLHRFCCIKKLPPIAAIIPAIALAVLGTYTTTTYGWSAWVWLYIAGLLLPIILGMMGRIQMRWVLLWEAVMLFPIGILALLLFGGALIGAIRGR